MSAAGCSTTLLIDSGTDQQGVTKGDSYAVDIELGIGLTVDSPDFQLNVSFPFNFTFYPERQ